MSKISVILISIILISSCSEKNKHKEEIKESIKQLKQTIYIDSLAIEDRRAAINNISQLSESKVKYDSLLNIQKLEMAEVEKLTMKKDSLNNELNK